MPCANAGSTDETGSSARITSGSCSRTREIATRCCCPPERSSVRAQSFSGIPTRESARYAARMSSRRGRINARTARRNDQEPSRPARTLWITRGASPNCVVGIPCQSSADIRVAEHRRGCRYTAPATGGSKRSSVGGVKHDVGVLAPASRIWMSGIRSSAQTLGYRWPEAGAKPSRIPPVTIRPAPRSRGRKYRSP